MTQRSSALALVVFVLLGTPIVASADGNDTADPFPDYRELRGHVGFWERAFGVWSMGEVAVHDMDHPAVVYEVVRLPGAIENRYTDEQKEFVERLRERWESRLSTLADRVEAGAELTDDEKLWALELTERGGFDAVRRAGERVRTQRGLRERFKRGLEISYAYDGIFREILREAGIPEDIAYLPHVESSFQYSARSSAGAVGLWQFTRGTGRRFMTVSAAYDERLDPITAARGAARYLAEAYGTLGNWPLALTSYNHGIAGMRRARDELGDDYVRIFREYRGRTFGFASKNFYAEFLAARNVARDPDRFFPEGHTPEPPFDRDFVVLESRTHARRLAAAFGLEPDAMAALNPAWTRHAVEDGYALPEGATVWLPAGTLAEIEARGLRPDYRLTADDAGVYVVGPGDTLSGIARAHGLTLSALREMNGLSRSQHLIRVGQKLHVGGAAPRVHVVRRGDSLIRIAYRHGVRLQELMHLNGLTESSVIHPGERLRLPG